MTELRVGEEFPLGDCRDKEGFFFEYAEDGMPYLVCAMPNMTVSERTAIMKNHGRIGLFMQIEVVDAAMGEGLGFYIFPVESTTNTLLGIRMVGMGNRWTKEFQKMVEEQKKMPFDKKQYFFDVAEAQRRWSSSDLLKLSSVSYKIGTGENDTPISILGENR